MRDARPTTRARLLAPSVLAYDVLTCVADGVDEHAAALRDGRSGLRMESCDGAQICVGRIADLCDGGPLAPPFGRYESRAARIAHRLAVRIAPRVAELDLPPARIGVVLGTSTGGLERTEAFLRGADLVPRFDLHHQHAIAALAELVAAVLGARGPHAVVSTACTSGAKAFGVARRWLALGLVDAVVVGGADGLCATTIGGFRALGVASSVPCRPFSGEPSGMNVSEGGALLLLARPDVGHRRLPIARLVGIGETSDAHHVTAPDPTGRGAEAAIRIALAEAAAHHDIGWGFEASVGRSGEEPARCRSVDYVNAHGTGTRHNDDAEAWAIARTLGHSPWVGSTKGATGHALGAAGAIEAAISILAIDRGFVPPSLGASDAAFGARLRLALDAVTMPIARVLSTSLAFGGSNAALVFDAPTRSAW